MKFTLRRILAAALSLTLLGGTLAGCGNDDTTMESEAAETAVQGVTFTDALGTEVQIESWDTVVSLYGSFAETWTLAGGTLAGVTEDAIEERNMELGDDVAMIGSVKSPSLESILAVNPDFVILSADIAAQVDMQQALTEAGIPHAYFRVDTFEDYLSMLELFCQMTGRSDLYEQNGALVEQKITKIKELTAGEEGPTGLLIRAFSTGAKAKGADNQTGYIMEDLNEFRKIQGDYTLGGMVICETSEQARRLYDLFEEEWQKYQPKPIKIKLADGTYVVGEPEVDYKSAYRPLKAGIILHDTDDKETRKQIVKDFKKNMTVDILIVFNMLLTGFDAPRLKRLYFGRKLKDHNLLQAITRVNRPYPGMRYGFVIDFADIKRNFKETNEAYLRELNRFNDVDETGKEAATDTFTQVIEDKEEIVNQMKKIRQTLFDYSYDNAEEFSSEISTEEDKAVLLDLKQALESAKNMANLVRTFGDEDMKEQFAKLEITKLPQLLSEVQRRIGIINQKEAFSTNDETKTLINEAMMDIEFTFSKIGQEEMRLISGGAELKEKWQRTIASFTQNFDQEDPEFMSLRDAFMERFKEHGFVIDTIAKFNEETQALDEIVKRLQDLQKRNNVLLKKYKGDEKFARVHKRIREVNKQREEKGQKPMFSFLDEEIAAILNIIKEDVDAKVYDRNDILKKDAYFGRTVMALINGCLYHFPQIKPEMDDYKFIQTRISQQYINQYNATYGIS